jgi:hypothetical protein
LIVNALPEQQRRVFPAVLSRQQGIDKNFLDMAQALFNCKVRPLDLANVWLELASIKYTNNFIDAELKNGSDNGTTRARFRHKFMLLFSDNSAARKLTTKLKVDEGDRLFTIVNTRSGSHWVAVEINLKKKIVTIMDSLRPKQGGAYYVELEMIGKRLQTWADTEAKLVHEGKGGPVSTLASLSCNLPWMFELCKVCPQQTNGYDCGLFALATVAARSRGATKHNVPDMKEQRIFLAAWIVSLHNNHVE